MVLSQQSDGGATSASCDRAESRGGVAVHVAAKRKLFDAAVNVQQECSCTAFSQPDFQLLIFGTVGYVVCNLLCLQTCVSQGGLGDLPGKPSMFNYKPYQETAITMQIGSPGRRTSDLQYFLIESNYAQP